MIERGLIPRKEALQGSGSGSQSAYRQEREGDAQAYTAVLSNTRLRTSLMSSSVDIRIALTFSRKLASSQSSWLCRMLLLLTWPARENESTWSKKQP